VKLLEGFEQGLFFSKAGTGAGVLHALKNDFLGRAGFGFKQVGILLLKGRLNRSAPARHSRFAFVWHG